MIVIDNNIEKNRESVKMATLGNSVFNWEVPCQEHELIRCKSVVKDNFKINKTPDENKEQSNLHWGMYR